MAELELSAWSLHSLKTRAHPGRFPELQDVPKVKIRNAAAFLRLRPELNFCQVPSRKVRFGKDLTFGTLFP